MKKFALLLAVFIFASCSTFDVKTEIDDGSVKSFKKSGFLFRMGGITPVSKSEYETALKNWLEGYDKKNELLIIEKGSDKISSYESDAVRFYQSSDDSRFLIQRSLGTISSYYKDNKAELHDLFQLDGLDSLIVFEVSAFYSHAIQNFGFDSVMTIFNQEGEILYLDHQYDSFKFDDFFPNSAKSKKHLTDKVCTRIVEALLKFGFIEEK